LRTERVACIGSDDRHRRGRKERARRDITALRPDRDHLDVLGQHLRLSRRLSRSTIIATARAAPECVAPKP